MAVAVVVSEGGGERGEREAEDINFGWHPTHTHALPLATSVERRGFYGISYRDRKGREREILVKKIQANRPWQREILSLGQFTGLYPLYEALSALTNICFPHSHVCASLSLMEDDKEKGECVHVQEGERCSLFIGTQPRAPVGTPLSVH